MTASVSATPSWREVDRLAALGAYHILDTAPEAVFDDIVTIAAHVCQAPIALVSLVAETRQWFKAETGLGVRETPIEQSICAHAIRQDDLFVVPDATQDSRFAANPLVTGEPYIRFYAGARLEAQDGFPLGTLCVIDRQVRPAGLTRQQADLLLALARQVVAHLEHHRALVRLAEQRAEMAESEARFRAVANLVPDLLWRSDPTGATGWYNRRWLDYTGQGLDEAQGYGWLDVIHPDERETSLVNFQSAVDEGRPFQQQHRIRAVDGRYRWFLVRAEPLRDGQGRILQWFGAATDIHDLRHAQEHQKLLLAELQHRVRNTLAVLRSIARRTADTSETVEDYTAHFDGRLDAFARVQAAVTRNPAAGVDLAHLVAEELLSYAAHEGERVSIKGPTLRLQPKAAETLALGIHELATNAVKYGALSSPKGRVQVTWDIADGEAGPRLALEWVESGVELDGAAPRRKGFGAELLERTLAYELKAKAALTFGSTGVRYAVDLPLTGRIVSGESLRSST